MNTANIGTTRTARSVAPFQPPQTEESEEEDNVENLVSLTLTASHQLINASTNNEWYTPQPFLEAAHQVMGNIDLDPASNFFANQIVKASRFYSSAVGYCNLTTQPVLQVVRHSPQQKPRLVAQKCNRL